MVIVKPGLVAGDRVKLESDGLVPQIAGGWILQEQVKLVINRFTCLLRQETGNNMLLYPLHLKRYLTMNSYTATSKAEACRAIYAPLILKGLDSCKLIIV